MFPYLIRRTPALSVLVAFIVIVFAVSQYFFFENFFLLLTLSLGAVTILVTSLIFQSETRIERELERDKQLRFEILQSEYIETKKVTVILQKELQDKLVVLEQHEKLLDELEFLYKTSLELSRYMPDEKYKRYSAEALEQLRARARS